MPSFYAFMPANQHFQADFTVKIQELPVSNSAEGACFVGCIQTTLAHGTNLG